MKKDPAVVKEMIMKKYSQRKFHLPVIGHFADRSVMFNTIMEAAQVCKINPMMIFEACIGKIYKAHNAYWEYEKGNHYLKYKAFYIRTHTTYNRRVGWNG